MIFAHDLEQARRRTVAQNEAIVGWLKLPRMAPYRNLMFGYTDVPPEGGPVILTAPTGEKRTIYEDGSYATDLSEFRGSF